MMTPTVDRLLGEMIVEVEAMALYETASEVGLAPAPSSAIEMHFVIEGELHLQVADGPLMTLRPGGVAMIPANLRRTLSARAETNRFVVPQVVSQNERNWPVYTTGEDADIRLRILAGRIRVGMCNVLAPFGDVGGAIAEDLSDVPVVQAVVEMLLSEGRSLSGASSSMTGTLMKVCLLLLLRRHLENPNRPNSATPALLVRPWLSRALAAILSDPSAPHTVAGLAMASGMSRSGFAKAFVETMGMTPIEFVLRARLSRARALLLTTDRGIAEVGDAVGFVSRSHFSRLFRQHHGADPTTFRKRGRMALGQGHSSDNASPMPE